jgi:hypothetical protein
MFNSYWSSPVFKGQTERQRRETQRKEGAGNWYFLLLKIKRATGDLIGMKSCSSSNCSYTGYILLCGCVAVALSITVE